MKNRFIPLIFLSLISLAIFVYQINRYPVNIGAFEGEPAMSAVRIAEDDAETIKAVSNRSQQPLFGTRGSRWNLFLVYPMVGVYKLLGFDMSHIAIRFIPIMYGVLSVISLYLLIEGMFGAKVGLTAAVLLAVSSWFIALTRLCSDFSATIFYSILCLLVYSKSGRNIIIHILLGGLLALGSYFYLPARMVALIVFTSIILRCLFEKRYLRRKWIAIIILAISFQSVCYLQKLDGIKYFTNLIKKRTSPVLASASPQNVIKSNWRTFHKAFFVKWGWTGASVTYERQVVFDPVSRWLFYIGLILAALRIRNHKYRLFLIWGTIATAPMLIGGARPKRGLLLIPVFCSLSAIGLGGGLELIGRWCKEFQEKPGKILKSIGLVIGAAVVCFIGYLNLDNYFGEYNKKEKMLLKKGNAYPQWNHLLETLKTHDLYTDCWMGEPYETGEYLALCLGRRGHLHQFKAAEAGKQFNKAKSPAALFLKKNGVEERK